MLLFFLLVNFDKICDLVIGVSNFIKHHWSLYALYLYNILGLLHNAYMYDVNYIKRFTH